MEKYLGAATTTTTTTTRPSQPPQEPEEIPESPAEAPAEEDEELFGMILLILINILESSQQVDPPSSKPADDENSQEDIEAKEQSRKHIKIYLLLGIDVLLENFKYRKEFLKKDNKLLFSMYTHFPDVFQQPSKVFFFCFFFPSSLIYLNFSSQSDKPESCYVA